MRLVHYLIRPPGKLGKLIYPIELADQNYQAYGSFFLGGDHEDDVDDEYIFHAIRQGIILNTSLRRISFNFVFLAEISGVGEFLFKAITAGVPANYDGVFPFNDGARLVRQLAPRDRAALEAAAFRHDFYFTGYSPRIEGEAS